MIVDLNVNGECRREIIYVGGVMMYLKTTEIYIVLLLFCCLNMTILVFFL